MTENLTVNGITEGSRVMRPYDGRYGTVVSVRSYVMDAPEGEAPSSYVIAVRMDFDGNIWSGTENGWASIEGPAEEPKGNDDDDAEQWPAETVQTVSAIGQCADCLYPLHYTTGDAAMTCTNPNCAETLLVSDVYLEHNEHWTTNESGIVLIIATETTEED